MLLRPHPEKNVAVSVAQPEVRHLGQASAKKGASGRGRPKRSLEAETEPLCRSGASTLVRGSAQRQGGATGWLFPCWPVQNTHERPDGSRRVRPIQTHKCCAQYPSAAESYQVERNSGRPCYKAREGAHCGRRAARG